MAIAWTTIAIVFALLPGVSFFFGAALKERFARDLIRTSVVGDVAGAFFVSLAAHSLSWYISATFFGFNIKSYIYPLVYYRVYPSFYVLQQIERGIEISVIYAFVISTASFSIGILLAYCGVFRYFSAFKWVKNLSSEDYSIITAYIATNVVENNRCLMYKGILEEYFLDGNGSFSYIVLRNCSKYFMIMDGDTPSTGLKTQLFPNHDYNNNNEWNYFLINGANISNVLFDKTNTSIVNVSESINRLNDELQRLVKDIQASNIRSQVNVTATRIPRDSSQQDG
ncbi:hypothetical protein GGR25_002266 [Kaistia hirudinis]|uniref:Uncharacterized protein n=1 Tax=Kaistia hirudinis TaxID=1293440 RepID=A0A840AS68_9HYPH|nr:hypothetical protein [Kaistia hirudinis]MBB3931216.1 hypothetical protein [Kaistia hirudinis]